MSRLVLFDIDETMLASNGAGRRAIARVLNDRFGVPESAMNVPMSGRTDPEILKRMFSKAGLEEKFEAHFQDVIEAYLGVLQEEIEKSRYFILHEGVVDLITALLDLESVFLGLLTGNVERGARMKLARFDLNQYFPVGAFGSDSHDRLDLPAIAKERAEAHYKQNFHAHELVIIGDSENDILCAHGFGASCIAVNTGRTSWDELEKLKPQFLFPNLKNTQLIVEAILSEQDGAKPD